MSMSNGAAKAFTAWIASHEPHADRPDEVFAAGFEAALTLLERSRGYMQLQSMSHGDIFQEKALYLDRIIRDLREGTWTD